MSIESTVAEARQLLASLGFDRERSNERSALVLLALLQIEPGQTWASASNPLVRTRDIMNWIRDKYEKDYAPNSRETIRRFTLHQFAETLLVEQNPDQPDRPVNSPKWCYQVPGHAIELIRRYGSSDFDIHLQDYRHERPSLIDQYAAARAMNRIPVTMQDGSVVALSPGGQNILIQKIVEDFCPHFTPGGRVLYIGDADSKWAVFEKTTLESLGVAVDQHGKMPDLVVYVPDRNWLVLVEAASSHGPVDAKRHSELKNLFGRSTAGLVFVSAFPDRPQMRRFLADIAWETEVWCADNPTHMIHFNGERFLGPYSN